MMVGKRGGEAWDNRAGEGLGGGGGGGGGCVMVSGDSMDMWPKEC